MTTASLQQRPASVVRASPTILKRPRYSELKKAPNATKPVLLRNLRNYYARRRPSMNISNKAPPSEDPPTDRKVKFFERVRVKRIPNRLSYSEEDKVSLWFPKKDLKELINKNHAEYAFEGYDWQNAPEENDGFGLRNGELVHPFYVWAQQEEASHSSGSEETPEDDSSSEESDMDEEEEEEEASED